MNRKIFISGFALLWCASVHADIPRPDAIVFGELRIAGELITATDSYTIVARVAGFEDPVAVYRMGDNPTAGDRYILHIPQALQPDGKTASAETPMAGAQAEIYVTGASGNPVRAGDVEIPASGEVRQLDLYLSSADENAGRVLNDENGSSCGAGTCGAVGSISPILLLCGLVQMRTRRRR